MQPLVPSAKLAARIQGWIDDMDTPDSLQNWPRRLCRRANALVIAGTGAFLWALRPSGEMLRLDTDDVRQSLEPETDSRYLYAVIASASERVYPELRELMPEPPPEVRRCPVCGGRDTPPRRSVDCLCCFGLGWCV